ncbi:MAG: preprotein translocase subunit YajC [Myxococcales bacterium]|nr:preprotein translocase subunit YajC [Myxococcales bacterium]MCB9531107.1 preprotein translocase subunit YajC [Myxococcales bacterium]MCB9533017.1 preprotein translocase subunit YajC [Myxococcales bacterium]
MFSPGAEVLSVVGLIGQAGPMPGGWLMLPAIVAVFYLLLWRPQQKQALEAQRFRDSLKDGDRVITAGGIHGRITRVEDRVVELEVGAKLKLRVERSQIVKKQDESASSDASP